MRRFICAANWKLNKNPEEAAAFFSEFQKLVQEDEQRHFLFFPPAVNLCVARDHLSDTKMGWGAQNVYFEKSGAFTGENSVEVLKQMGGTHALVGHSERRNIFGEDDSFLAKKVNSVQSVGLCPVLCLGEQLAQRESGDTNEVITQQLQQSLKLADLSKPVVIAYEPVWAIGTGQVATPEQAEAAHAHLRNVLRDLTDASRAEEIAILYGGSVKAENAKELSEQPNIDGFLVGGASLKPDSFYEIYKQARS